MCKFLTKLFKKEKTMGNPIDTFEAVAIEITKIDKGGEAGEQLNIAEARQSLSTMIKLAAQSPLLVRLAKLIVKQAEK